MGTCTVRAVIGAGILVSLLAGCGLAIPRDPDGTLDTVSGGVMRVGISPSAPFTELDGGTGDDPAGTEVELVERFAGTLDATIEWTAGGEGHLVRRMEHGELDLLIGGLTADSPWADLVALTGPYLTTEDEHGTREHVMAVPIGENAFLVKLEHFLQHRDDG